MNRITRFLIPVSWTLWSIVFLVLVWAFGYSLVDKSHSPEVSHGLGTLVTVFLLLAFVGVGLCLYLATRSRSTAWLIILTLLLAYLVFMLIAIPSVRAFKTWRNEREMSWVVEHSDPVNAKAGNHQRGTHADVHAIIDPCSGSRLLCLFSSA